jgi:hypothetical protein
MTDAAREESETGKFSIWVYVKNWITDYFKASDIDIDVNKYVSTNVKNLPVDFPSSDNTFLLGELYDELGQKLETAQLNIDGSKNVGVNVKTITEELPDAATKNNGRYILHYDGDGLLETIDIVIGGQEWRKILSYTTGRLTGISAWSEMM